MKKHQDQHKKKIVIIDELRSRALLEGDAITVFVSHEINHVERLVDTLRELQDFILVNYDFGNNPLHYLRKIFPDFEWRLEWPKSTRDLHGLALKADYLFLKETRGIYCGVVVAVRHNPDNFYSTCHVRIDPRNGGRMRGEWPKEFLELEGVRII